VSFTSRKWAITGGSLAILAALAAAPGSALGDTPVRTTVELEIAVGTGRGRVLCAVYERNGWLKRPVKGSAGPIQGRTATCRFSDLRPGTYAAGAFQDENLNGRLDRSWTGAPSEPWCVTREVRGTLRPPSFDSASFTVRDGAVHLRCRAR
jgi:uncharacterized protein (DUF2141 family)